MISDRKAAFDKICRGFAIARYEVESHQAIADYSLNVHGENFYRDILNYILDLNLVNTNFQTQNADCIDLHDPVKKLGVQVTTTRTKEKLINTLNVFSKPEFQDHEIQIYFLLDKAAPNSDTVKELENTYGVDVRKILFDYGDLVKIINNLSEPKLIHLAQNYFESVNERYTDEVALNLIINHLVASKKKSPSKFDESFGTIPVKEKLELNKIGPKISAHINLALDYRHLVDRLSTKDNLLADLRSLVIDEIYTEILCQAILGVESVPPDKRKNTEYLHGRAISLDLDFNNIMASLYENITSRVEIKDFNSSDVSWVIISYFFEICDVGAHKK